jgi:hypothetical protein
MKIRTMLLSVCMISQKTTVHEICVCLALLKKKAGGMEMQVDGVSHYCSTVP